MATLYKTSFHRFNTVASNTGVDNASVLVSTGLGTASLLDIGDTVRLSNPTIIDDSGTTQTFSTEISNAGHTNYTIKGIQIQIHISCSVLSPFPDLRHQVRLNGGTDIQIIEQTPLGAQPYGPRLHPNSSQPLNTFTLDLNTTNVDDLEITTDYTSTTDSGDWFALSNTFASGTPTPAIRIWYEPSTRTTITTGRVSITDGRVAIS